MNNVSINLVLIVGGIIALIFLVDAAEGLGNDLDTGLGNLFGSGDGSGNNSVLTQDLQNGEVGPATIGTVGVVGLVAAGILLL
jgi:hypothetical protein